MEPFSFVNPVTDSTLSLLFILMERSDIVSFSGINTHGDIGHCPILRYLFSWRDRTLSYSQVFTLMERSDTVLSSGIYSHGEIGHCPILSYFLSWRYQTLSYPQIFILMEISDFFLSLATFYRLKSKIGVSECTELIIFIFLCLKSTNFIV